MIRPTGLWPRLRWRCGVLWHHVDAGSIVLWLSLETIEAAARISGLRW